jgi:hypothetical protein
MIEDYRLYVLVRNDMLSLAGGKMAAQVAHAANQFVKLIKSSDPYYKEFKKWQGSLGYGTTIVLSANEKQIEEIMNRGFDNPMGVVIDETYPLKDGRTTHYFPCMTCGYTFGPRRFELVSHLELMK